MKIIFPLLAVVLLAGCASTPKTKTISFDSEPRGARVFVAYGADENGAKAKDFLGVTPFQWTTETDGEGFKLPGALVYSIFVPPVAVFTAEPPSGATNFFAKHQVFHGGTIATHQDRVPSGIFFDLTKP